MSAEPMPPSPSERTLLDKAQSLIASLPDTSLVALRGGGVVPWDNGFVMHTDRESLMANARSVFGEDSVLLVVCLAPGKGRTLNDRTLRA